MSKIPIPKQQLTTALLAWFKAKGRDLPWRKTYNPYHVWISEIMLQQTQMERGVGFFLRWIERFPDVQAVAEAEQQEILKYWEGLGYYARARNLHKAAKVMMAEHGGEVPCDHAALLSLPGIGPYTAAAIASVAGNVDVPVVDANVLRIFARILDIATPIKEAKNQQMVSTLMQEMLPSGRARMFNQAVMDLGGVVCTPKNPRCGDCPVQQFCQAYAAGTVGARPVLAKPKKAVYINKLAAFIEHDGCVFIQQRNHNEVWGGLWEFPGGEGRADDKKGLVCMVKASVGLDITVDEELATVTHQYTHHKITLTCYACRIANSNLVPKLNGPLDGRWVDRRELGEYGFPAGPRKVLARLAAL